MWNNFIMADTMVEDAEKMEVEEEVNLLNYNSLNLEIIL